MTNQNQHISCGVVSIVGRPNVGKSTLLNRLVGEKIAIVSKVPQTTRNQIRGIYTDERGQIIFIDTPGIHFGRDKLDQYMNSAATTTVTDADCIIHLVDVTDAPGKEEEQIVERLIELKVPVILGLNKVDKGDKHIPEYIALWEEMKGVPVQQMKKLILLPLSGQKDIHIEKLYDILFSLMPQGPALYPQDIVCDVPKNMAMADIIREKLFNLLRQELPHSVAVIIENVQPRKGNTTLVQALILVEKDNQKEIVIGKGGENLKTVGTQSRIELEELMEKKVFLELYVKSKKNWRENISLLQEMGYHSL